MKQSVFVETKALFSVECPDVDDTINEINGDFILSDETKMYPTPFYFDFADVIAVNCSCHKGYSTVRFNNDAFTIKMDFKVAQTYFRKSRGLE